MDATLIPFETNDLEAAATGDAVMITVRINRPAMIKLILLKDVLTGGRALLYLIAI